MRESRRLGHARRAARVDEQGDVVHGGGACFVPGGGCAHGACPRASPGGARASKLVALVARGLEGQLERQARGRGKGRRQVHREGGVASAQEGQLLQGLGPGDRHARAVARVLALELAGGSKRVVFDDDGAQQHRAQDCNRVLGAVGHDESDAVSRAHARLVQGPRAPTHLLDQLLVGELAGEKVDGGTLGIAGGDLQDHIRDRLVGSGDFVGDAGRIERPQRGREVHLCSFGGAAPTIP